MGTPGAFGNGGQGIRGSNLTVINTGSISGGLAGDGSTRANAITLPRGHSERTFNGPRSTPFGHLLRYGVNGCSQDLAVIRPAVLVGEFSAFVDDLDQRY